MQARLAVLVALAGLEPSAPRQGVDGDVDARESVYLDNDHTWVSTTRVAASVSPEHEPLTLRVGYLADVISSASVDVVSAATGRFRETRHQGSGGLSLDPGEWQIDFGYAYSNEPDWKSHTATASVGHDFFMRNTNVTVGYAFTHNAVGRFEDPDFHDTVTSGATTLTYTQVLGRKTTSRVIGYFAALDGLQSSPYRYVPIGGATETDDPTLRCVLAAQCPLERHPRERYRFALMGVLAHHVGRRRAAAIRGSYRFYGDTWAIFSHALELDYRIALTRRLQLRAQSRTYFQDRAFFYEERYARELTYLSVDRELSTFLHQLTGLKLTFATGPLGGLDDLRFDIKGDVAYFHFFDFVWLPRRLAGVVEAGVSVVF